MRSEGETASGELVIGTDSDASPFTLPASLLTHTVASAVDNVIYRVSQDASVKGA